MGATVGFLRFFTCVNFQTSIADPDSNPDPQPPDAYVFDLLDPDPDPLVRGMDPDLDSDPDPSITKQK
jgi:hypothetical protein